jgi:hypothetical protein
MIPGLLGEFLELNDNPAYLTPSRYLGSSDIRHLLLTLAAVKVKAKVPWKRGDVLYLSDALKGSAPVTT